MTNFLYKNDLPDDLDLGNSIAIDTEAMGLKTLRDRLCLVQISTGDGNSHLVKFELGNDYSATNLKKLLSNNQVIKIFHYARFDLAILKHSLKIDINNIYCTKIASRLVRTYTDSHGLKSISEELLGIEISKKQQSSYWGGETLSEDQIKYAASDVLYLHKLKEKLDQMLEREGRAKFFKDCCQFLGTRVELDLAGFSEDDIFKH